MIAYSESLKVSDQKACSESNSIIFQIFGSVLGRAFHGCLTRGSGAIWITSLLKITAPIGMFLSFPHPLSYRDNIIDNAGINGGEMVVIRRYC